MLIRFWGVRGSIPTPLRPAKIRSKISSVIARLRPEDLVNRESRELFLSTLPDYLFSTVGGNTSCVEVSIEDSPRIILDAGTGIRELGMEIKAAKRATEVHIFFSHFHWDHIQGLPFFAPAFDPANSIYFHSPVENFQDILEKQMCQPYFPVTMGEMAAIRGYHVIKTSRFEIGPIEIRCRPMCHPGGCYSYSFQFRGKKVIYSTDTELREEDFIRNRENAEYFQETDLLILDTQYTLGEAIEKYNWGHSSFSMAADFAATWGIKSLALFHHEPSYSDLKVTTLLKNAKWYVEHLESKGIVVHLAREGLELEV